MTDRLDQIESFTMSFGDHLEELRKRVIIGACGPLLLSIVCLVFGKQLLGIIALPLLETQRALGMPSQLYVFTAQGGFAVYMKVGLMLGITLGMPWLVYQLWVFVSQGLYPHEKRFVIYLIPSSLTLAIMGILFMYFIMMPIMLLFLLSFSGTMPSPNSTDKSLTQPIAKYFQWITRSASPIITTNTNTDYSTTGAPDKSSSTQPADPSTSAENAPEITLPQIPILSEAPQSPANGAMWIDANTNELIVNRGGTLFRSSLRSDGLMSPMMQINDYISFIMWMSIAFAISFQLPLVMLLLAFTDIVRYNTMRKAWRIVIVCIAVASALLTPADPVSMVLLALPMVGLYIGGLIAVKWIVGQPKSVMDEEE